MPPLSERIKNYLEELNKWESAGKPTRSIDRIKELYEVCKGCPNYFDTFGIGGRCNLCGCLINTGVTLNKLSLATTRCPDDPPKWIEELEQEKNSIKIEKPQIQQANDKSAAKTNCCS